MSYQCVTESWCAHRVGSALHTEAAWDAAVDAITAAMAAAALRLAGRESSTSFSVPGATLEGRAVPFPALRPTPGSSGCWCGEAAPSTVSSRLLSGCAESAGGASAAADARVANPAAVAATAHAIKHARRAVLDAVRSATPSDELSVWPTSQAWPMLWWHKNLHRRPWEQSVFAIRLKHTRRLSGPSMMLTILRRTSGL